MKICYLLCVLFFLNSLRTLCQSEANTIKSSDTTTVKQVSAFEIPPIELGEWKSEFEIDGSDKFISKRDILEVNYTTLSDIIAKSTSFFPLSPGMYGQYNSVSAYGAGSRDISFAYNGRNINDADYGNYNTEIFPVELFQKFEIYTGSEAICYGDNSSGAFINLQEIKYNTATPYTRLWYAQGGGEFIAADGIFSQNIAPNLNMTFGFRSMHSDGFYENEKLNSWNARIKLRYDFNHSRSISITENYSYLLTGLNGGIKNVGNDIFNEFYADVNYKTLDERSVIHDITGIYSERIAYGLFTSSLYFTNTYRYKNADDFFIEPNLNLHNIDFYNNKFGLNARLEKNYNKIEFLIGADVNYMNVNADFYTSKYNDINYAEFAKFTFKFNNFSKISFTERFSYLYNKFAFNYGLRFNSNILLNKPFYIDLSYSKRVPTPTEGFGLESENHILGILSFKSFRQKKEPLEFEAFVRYIQNPIKAYAVNDKSEIINRFVFENSDAITIYGISTNINGNINNKFFYLLKPCFTYEPNSEKERNLFPIFSAFGEVYYKYDVIKSNAKIGISFNFLSKFNGRSFSPLGRTYYEIENNNQVYGNSINLFALLKLSTANVKIEYQNLLNTKYYYIPFYPQLGRNLRLSVSVPFI